MSHKIHVEKGKAAIMWTDEPPWHRMWQEPAGTATARQGYRLLGEKCEKLMNRLIVNVPVTDVQCDEIWGHVQRKEAHELLGDADDGSIGDSISKHDYNHSRRPLRLRTTHQAVRARSLSQRRYSPPDVTHT
jgi:hypothetical protein